jgi:TonB family protein
MVPRLVCVAVVAVVGAQELKPVRTAPFERYPPLAHQARIAGDVRVKCVLNKDGSVADAFPESGHPILAKAAVSNVKLWRFASVDFEPKRASEVIVRFRFRLVQPGTEGTDLDTLKANTRVDSDSAFVVTAPQACIDFVPCSAHWR